jgi:hypothetical protein
VSVVTPLDAARAGKARCGDCRHRLDARHALEKALPGWSSFGSADGATVADSRLCLMHDCWVSPDDGCGRFSPVG